jgi:hypothetical protein
MDHMGYARITDMGIARIMRPENNQDTSGTPGYMGLLSYYVIIPQHLKSCAARTTHLQLIISLLVSSPSSS